MSDYREIMGELGRLQARIRELQRIVAQEERTSTAAEADDHRSALLCAVDDDTVAFELRHVEEVLPTCILTAFPQAPLWHVGMLNLRGEMVPVLDVACRLGRPARHMALSDCIVIARTPGQGVGLLVQEVRDIIKVHRADLQDVSVGVPEAPYVLGTFRYRERGAFLVDVPALVDTSQLPEAGHDG